MLFMKLDVFAIAALENIQRQNQYFFQREYQKSYASVSLFSFFFTLFVLF